MLKKRIFAGSLAFVLTLSLTVPIRRGPVFIPKAHAVAPAAAPAAFGILEAAILLTGLWMYVDLVCRSKGHDYAWRVSSNAVAEKSRDLVEDFRQMVTLWRKDTGLGQEVCVSPSLFTEKTVRTETPSTLARRSFENRMERMTSEPAFLRFTQELAFFLQTQGVDLHQRSGSLVEFGFLSNQMDAWVEDPTLRKHLDELFESLQVNSTYFAEAEDSEKVVGQGWLSCLKSPEGFMLLYGSGGYLTAILVFGFFLTEKIALAIKDERHRAYYVLHSMLGLLLAYGIDKYHRHRTGYRLHQEPEALYREFRACMAQKASEFKVENETLHRALGGSWWGVNAIAVMVFVFGEYLARDREEQEESEAEEVLPVME